MIVLGPVPPPFHGVTVITAAILQNGLLHQRFVVTHLDTSDRRNLANIGRWEFRNVWLGIGAVARLTSQLRGDRGVVYLPLSQNTAGFLRDSMFVMVSRLRRWRIAMHLHGGEFDRFVSSANPVLRWWIRFTMARVDSVAVLANCLRSVVGGILSNDQIAVVGYGIADLKVDDSHRDSNQVLFLSNLFRRKGVIEAVQTALLVRERRPDTKFTFAGEWESPALRSEVMAIVRDAGGAINFVGVPRGRGKADLLGRACVFLFPPKEPEGQPLVILEAMAAGIAIVTTDRGAIGSTVGESGVIVAEPDPHELAEALIAVLSDPELRRSLGHAARRRYLAEFTQEHFDRRMVAWLSSVLTCSGD